MQSELDALLINAYRETECWVTQDHPVVLRVDVPSAELASLYKAKGATCAAFITACNPFSRELTDAENAEQGITMSVRNMTQDEVRELGGKGLVIMGQLHRIKRRSKQGTKSDADGLAVTTYDRKGLMGAIRQQFRINWDGVHGPSHWARVRHHALRLCKLR